VQNESSVIVDATPGEVWDVLADLRNWPSWMPDYEILELGEVTPGAGFRWRLGKVKISSTFAVVTPERELTWSGAVFGYTSVDMLLLAALPGGGTRVTMAESLAGPLVSVLFSTGRLRAQHERYLAALKKEVIARSTGRRRLTKAR
jgi:hypothetical protein